MLVVYEVFEDYIEQLLRYVFYGILTSKKTVAHSICTVMPAVMDPITYRMEVAHSVDCGGYQPLYSVYCQG